jgi:hypothetical protein
MDAGPCCTNLWHTNYGGRAFWLAGIERIREWKDIPSELDPSGPLTALAGLLYLAIASFAGVFHHGIVGTIAWHYRTTPKSLWNVE